MLRAGLLRAATSPRVRRVLERTPSTRVVVNRFVAGESAAEAIAACHRLIRRGCMVTLDYLGEDTTSLTQARSVVTHYHEVLSGLRTAGIAQQVEMSLKLSALGQALSTDGESVALDHAREIASTARDCGTSITVDMENHLTTDSTLRVVGRLREDFPTTGAVIQAYLHRSPEDCRMLAHPGSRVRLCKGAYREPSAVALQDREDIRQSYVKCAGTLMSGGATPLLATHDPRLITQIRRLVVTHDLSRDDFEFPMLYGIRPNEQERLVADGFHVRVYVPFGEEWYGYLMRRMAERPANVGLFLRSLTSRN